MLGIFHGCIMSIKSRSHFSIFVSIRLSCIEPHIAPVLYKKRKEKHKFCPFTLIHLITKNTAKNIHLCAFALLCFVKLIVEYWSVLNKLGSCAFTQIMCVFKNLLFCEYPLLLACSKTSALVAFLCESM